MAELSRRDFRAIIYYNFKRGLTSKDCFEEMRGALGESSPSEATVKRHYANFRREDFDFEDDPRSGRPSTSVTEETVAAVRKIVTEDRHITYQQIQQKVGIHAASVHTILHDHLHLRKLCTLWVPQKLTEEQKKARVEFCKKTLKEYKEGKAKNIYDIVTGDETWMYFYDVPTKQQSQQWVFEDEPTPVEPRSQRTLDKRMYAVFFTVRGFLTAVKLEKGKTSLLYLVH